MKFYRILAMLLAIMLMSAFCYAEEAAETTDETATTEEEYPTFDTLLLSGMEISYEEYMISADTRALFASLFMLELGLQEETFHITELNNTYGMPTIYIAAPNGELEGQCIQMFLFYMDETGESGSIVSASYLVELGVFNGFVMENTIDPALTMEYFKSEEMFLEYYPVTMEELYTAMVQIDSIINGAE